MRKLFKKSLACILTAIICVSLCVAAVPASAEAPTYSTNEVVAKAGEAVEIDFTVSNFANVKGAMIKFFLPEVVASVTEVKINGEALEAYNPETGAGYYEVDEEEMSIKFLSLFGYEGELASADALTFAVKAVIADDAAVGTYNYAAPIFQVSENGTNLVEVTGTFAKFEIIPAGPIVDDTLTFRSASVGYGTSSLEMSFRINVSVLNKYADMELVIIPQKYDTTDYNLIPDTAEIVIAKANLANVGNGATMKQYTYKEIQLYELGLKIEYMLKGYDANGKLVAESPVYSTSPADYLKGLYAGTSDAKFRALITDTLIVGNESALSVAKSKPTSDLATATSIIEGFDISNATKEIGTPNTVDSHVAVNADFGTANSAKHRVMRSVTVGKSPFITYRVKDANSVLDLDKLSFKVSYNQTTGKGTSQEYSMTFTTANANIEKIGQFINFKFDQVGILDGAKDVVCEISYDGAVVATTTYSVESYLNANLGNAAVVDLFTALIKIGVSGRNYLA